MTRKEYMEQLKKYLKRLPKEDYDNAIEYFSEYFDEAEAAENEQQVMEELGQPKEAARELLLNLLQESVGDSKDITEEKTAALPAAGSYYGDSSHAHSRTDSGNLSTTGYSTSAGKERSPGKIILLAFLVICASPVSIALLFAGLAVLAAVVLVIAAVIFSMAVTGVSAIAGGIVLTGFGMTLIARSLAAACMMVGSGFLMAGAGILVGVLTIYILSKGDGKMKKFMDFMETKVAPVFAKLGANPYIVGVKDGMVATVPFTIFGSLFIIIQQFPNDAWLAFIEPYKAMLGVPKHDDNGDALLCMSAFSVGYNLAKEFKQDGLMGGIVWGLSSAL